MSCVQSHRMIRRAYTHSPVVTSSLTKSIRRITAHTRTGNIPECNTTARAINKEANNEITVDIHAIASIYSINSMACSKSSSIVWHFFNTWKSTLFFFLSLRCVIWHTAVDGIIFSLSFAGHLITLKAIWQMLASEFRLAWMVCMQYSCAECFHFECGILYDLVCFDRGKCQEKRI